MPGSFAHPSSVPDGEKMLRVETGFMQAAGIGGWMEDLPFFLSYFLGEIPSFFIYRHFSSTDCSPMGSGGLTWVLPAGKVLSFPPGAGGCAAGSQPFCACSGSLETKILLNETPVTKGIAPIFLSAVPHVRLNGAT